MKNKRLLSLFLSLILVLFGSFTTVFAEGETVPVDGDGAVLSETGENGYSSYIKNLSGVRGQEIILSDTETPVSAGDTAEYSFDIAADADYELYITYRVLSRADLEVALKIDGAYPFDEAGHLVFQGLWENGADRYDGAGNEIAPQQIRSEKAVGMSARDFTGAHNDPYLFRMTAGRHTLSLDVNMGEAIILSVKLSPCEAAPKYKSPDKKSGVKEVIRLEGEDADHKSAFSLVPMSDNASAEVYPNDPVLGKLNYIGGSNWKNSGDTVSWTFNVKKDGYYSLAAVYRQNINLGAISYRHLKIDGKTPFAEAREIKFKYSASWDTMTFGGDDPYFVWLDSGEHTLSLSVTSGEMAEVYSTLQSVGNVMGDLYIDITMLVGETVDTYRSYELFNQIPDYNKRMKYSLKTLNALAEKIEKLQEKSSGSMVSTITNAAQILEKMLDQPYSAHKYKTAFYNSYTNLGALVGSIAQMPLDIDRIYLVGQGAEMPENKVSFIKKFSFGVSRFAATFTEEYDNISANDTEDSLTLWVNWGRDQAQVLTALINEDFTPEHNIGVTVKVVNATIIQGILAGKGPDVMLHMGGTEPVNLAMRGALVDLSKFDDFEKVCGDFVSDATVPYQYNGGTYALPDTLAFDMLFIRKDIFADLELKIPENWDEFCEVATEIQRNNLQVYMPASLYQTMLAQNDLPLYDMEKGITTLTGAEQIQCFIDYTDWYTKYKLPKTMDSFFNRFRIGSVPMGISPYTLITQLEVAAPEIAGRWTVVPLPATVGAKGERNFTSSASGTGCAITKLSENPEKAWAFLKWWVSGDVQSAYSNNLESLLGPLGRVSTASNSAFDGLGWSSDLVPAIVSQKENIINFPQLPGGYYVARGIDQAYWNVVEQNANPTDVMLEWGEIVNQEMLRKKAEYE